MRSRLPGFKLLLGMAVAIFSILSLPIGANAQLTRGAINGTVRDSAGAIVTGATVRVVSPRYESIERTTTNDEVFIASVRWTRNLFGRRRVGGILQGRKNRAVVVQTSLEYDLRPELKAGGVTVKQSTLLPSPRLSRSTRRTRPSD